MINRGFRRAVCYYDLLKVSRQATAKEIKSSYFKLAMDYHPDRHSDPAKTEMYHKLSEAYNALIDDDKRFDYDIQKGYLNAFDIDRLEESKMKFGYRYSNPVDLWDQLKNADQALADQMKHDEWSVWKNLLRGLLESRQRRKEKDSEVSDVSRFRAATLLSASLGFVVVFHSYIYIYEHLV